MKPSKELTVLKNGSIFRRLLGARRGQSFVLITIALVAICGMVAIVVDVGSAYIAYQQLRAQTQAAALAGGSVMSNDGETANQVKTTATDYSGQTGDANLNSGLLTNVQITPTLKCLTSAAAIAAGVPYCTAASPCGCLVTGFNALSVTETATVSTTFARVLGFNSFSLSATAMASAKGGFNGPYNVAIVVDTTASMNQSDSGNCNSSKIACALQGVQTLLSTLSPCAGGLSSCGSASTSQATVPSPATGTLTASNVTNAVDEVSLFAFPGPVSTAQAQLDTNCSGTNPAITSYNGFFPNNSCTGAGAPAACCTSRGEGNCSTTYTPPEYEIVPFSSDYRASDTATSLITGSNLVIAAGAGCSKGIGAPGGEGTFYAGVIDTAQSALATAAAARANTKNVMILVSDGEANADAPGPGVTDGMEAPTPAPAKVYPAPKQCAQAVASAQAAAAAGTTVYAVAYGSESTGCTTDTGTYSSPVCTMQAIANSPTTAGSYQQNNANFFTDVSSTKSSCASSARSTSTLDQIFKTIAGDLTVSRLIPNGTT
jgi:hypothetical protein